jgi:hypothetical protein
MTFIEPAPDDTSGEQLVSVGVFRARQAFTRTFVADLADAPAVHAAVDVRIIDGRPRVAAVHFNPPLDAEDVAKVDYVGMVAMALLEEFHWAMEEYADEAPPRIIDTVYNLTRRNNRWSPTVARDVADWYEEGGASLVAARMHVSRRQADRYIARARREGAL